MSTQLHSNKYIERHGRTVEGVNKNLSRTFVRLNVLDYKRAGQSNQSVNYNQSVL